MNSGDVCAQGGNKVAMTAQEAEAAAWWSTARVGRMDAYQCPYCRCWHMRSKATINRRKHQQDKRRVLRRRVVTQ